jgi:threonyl-tRNA synthetase
MQDNEITQVAGSLAPEEARLYRIRHSLAHVLAQAVMEFRPGTKLGFGPPIENGFYYDFDLPEPITAEELPKLEKAMRRIIQAKQVFVRTELSPKDAAGKVAALGQPFKDEAVRELGAKGVAVISFYENGPFVDMCEGPHCETTGDLPQDAFKLDSIAGAYWKGSEKNPMLTRIYGLAFRKRPELEAYLAMRKLAMERDHKKLGRELDLFHIEDEIGKGLVLWLPKGTVLRDAVEDLMKETEFRYGYQRVATPHIARQELYYRSGHLPYFKDSMFPPLVVEEHTHDDDGASAGDPPAGDLQAGGAATGGAATGAAATGAAATGGTATGDTATGSASTSSAPAGTGSGDGKRQEVFYLKPMNCPHHHMIFRARPRSYRDLPLRLAEYGTCYRFEQSGELSGLLRVRCFSMNDAHLYCSPDQLKGEIVSLLTMYRELYALFEYDRYSLRLSLHDSARTDKYAGDEDLWQRAESILRETLDELGMSYAVGMDEAAFYGPKIDIQFKNLLGREETVSTIQVDFIAAQKFELHYIDEHGAEMPPVVIHRAPLSTHERIMAYLIEHYGGAFPTWMAPVQVRLIPIADDLVPQCEAMRDALRGDRVRAEIDTSTHSFNKKIRNGSTEKVPILLVIGRKEAEEGTVTVRRYKVARQETVPFAEFHARVLEEIRERRHVKPQE